MIKVNENYKKASEETNRSSYVIAKYGQFDKSLKSKINSVTSAEKQNFSNLYKVYNDIKETVYNYITCEPNRVRLNDTFYFISDKNKSNDNEKIAYYSKQISNELGVLETPQQLILSLNELVKANDILLTFQEICSDINVKYLNDNVIVANIDITNNSNLTLQVKVPYESQGALYNAIVISFKKTNLPYRLVKLNEIDFGAFRTFTNDEIKDLSVIDELSIDSSELTSNFMSLTIDDTNGDYNILNPKNDLAMLQEKQEVTLYHYLKVGNAYKEVPLGTFLLKEFKINKNSLTIEAYDDTYFMNKIYYGSKYYNNEELKNVLLDLFTYFDYTKYIIDNELDGIKLTGYIPNVEFREALRMICEASCCVVNKTRYGETYIFKTYDPSVKTFNKRLIFQENHSRNLFNNVIDIVEYNYLETPNQEVYRAKLKVGEHTIIYDDYPILQNTLVKSDENNNNYIIKSQHATSCVVKVTNETEVILKAILMKQSTSVKRYKKYSGVTYDEYAISKIDNPLVTTSNSQNVSDWKLGRQDVKYNFNTLVAPYIEVGDTCRYVTNFNTINPFIVTRLEFDKTLIQNIEGE